MARVPRSSVAAIQYFQNHLEPWENNLTAIGLTQAKLSAISAAVIEAQTAYENAEKARQTSKAATDLYNEAVETMRTVGASCLRAIVVKAEDAPNPVTIYGLAQVDPPAPDEAAAPPDKPVDFVFTLELGGALGMSFKSKSNGSRPYWTIFRSLDGGPFVVIGSTTNRNFIDSTLPLGTESVTYAARGYVGATGGQASDEMTLRFGVGGGGGRTAMYNGEAVAIAKEAAA